MASDKVNEHKFGVRLPTDVVLIVEDEEFHCHRSMLSIKSPFFSTLFSSNFKEKNEHRIPIEADSVPFRRIMEILYDGCFGDHEDLFNCKASERMDITYAEHNRKLWTEATALLKLADRLLVHKEVHNVLQGLLWTSLCDYNPKGGCYHCATKLIFAIQHNMDKCKHLSPASRKAVRTALERLQPLDGEFVCSMETIKWLMDRE